MKCTYDDPAGVLRPRKRLRIKRTSPHRNGQLLKLLQSAWAAAENHLSSQFQSVASDMTAGFYRTGDAVPQSGIYEVAHKGEHREPHTATLISGEPFPGCETCKEAVLYRLMRTAPYIFHDDDFRKLE
jgi:hypothetical protein